MEGWLDTSITAITLFIMLIGLFGLVVPIFPGIFVMWLAALGYGVVTDFSTLGIILFVLISLLMVIGIVIDNIFMGVGAHQGGASWITLGVAFLVGVIGTIIFPPFGGIIAAPVAVFLLELLRFKDLRKAWLAFRGLAAGWGVSFVARFGVGVLMVTLWGMWV
ncbi:DUF456 family protein [Chloroflexota bacterium]